MKSSFWGSFLGALAAIVVTTILSGLLSMVVFVVMIAGAMSSERQPVDIKHDSVLVIDLSAPISERPTVPQWMEVLQGADTEKLPLNELVAAIRHAASDDRIQGIYLECNGSSVGLAQSQAILEALNDFKDCNKWIWSYADNYTQSNYMLASVADSLMLNPSGMLELKGLATQLMFFKGLLDKIGVEVQVVKVGTYKSAVEPFILNGISDANREQVTHYLGAMWDDMSATIAANRGLHADTIRQYATEYTFSLDPTQYVERKLVDRLCYGHEVQDMLAKVTGEEKYDDARLVDLDDYIASNDIFENNSKDAKRIAVLYAVGEIYDSGKDGISAEYMVPQIHDLIDEDDIDGLVLRVNSPGGSAYASEQIWEALEQFKKVTGKPFFVSMSDLAASGGYYISCGADRIYAEPLTLTGSIGIFGMIPNASKLLNDKLGVHVSTVTTSGMQDISIVEPMSPGMAAAMQGYVNRGYELFTKRCAQGRHMSQDSIKAIAEGRVWDGATALEIGLVDCMGSLETALNDMSIELDSPGNYVVREYPTVKLSIWEELMSEMGNIKASWVRSELGDAAPVYDAVRSVQRMSPLQCRMDYLEVK